MMFASILHLDRKAISGLKIVDPYSIHRVVYGLFEDIRDDSMKISGHSSGILYADQGGDFSNRQILILTNRMPISNSIGGYGKVETKEIPLDFLEHENYKFKIIINPTRRNSGSRKLIPLTNRKEIMEWFIDRAESKWGFSVLTEHLQIDKIEVLNFKGKSNSMITIGQASVQGILSPNDFNKFKCSFSQGIGRAKSFGCGLMQIVPINIR